MRVLHTSDWHVGRTLHRVSRLEETRTALQEVAEIAGREAVDVIVVCGDIYENLSPTAEAEQVVYEALERFSDLDISTVVISGNHDHPGRWNALKTLLRRANVYAAGDLLRPDEGGIIEVPSRSGRTILQIAAVPWVSPRRLFGKAELMSGGEKSHQSYAQGMAEAMAELCAAFEEGKCHLLAAHLFVSDSLPSGSERPLTIGDLYAVTPNAIPASVQYAALGHVHRAQAAPGVAAPAAYSGSLLPLDFGEIDPGTGISRPKTVNIVDLAPSKPAQIRQEPIRSPRQLRDVAGSLDSLASLHNDSDSEWLRVHLTADYPQVGLSNQVREILPNALSIHLNFPNETETEALDVRSKSPRELFTSYMTGRYQVDPDKELVDLFEQLHAEAVGELARGHLSLLPDKLEIASLEDTHEDILPDSDDVDILIEAGVAQ